MSGKAERHPRTLKELYAALHQGYRGRSWDDLEDPPPLTGLAAMAMRETRKNPIANALSEAIDGVTQRFLERSMTSVDPQTFSADFLTAKEAGHIGLPSTRRANDQRIGGEEKRVLMLHLPIADKFPNELPATVAAYQREVVALLQQAEEKIHSLAEQKSAGSSSLLKPFWKALDKDRQPVNPDSADVYSIAVNLSTLTRQTRDLAQGKGRSFS